VTAHGPHRRIVGAIILGLAAGFALEPWPAPAGLAKQSERASGIVVEEVAAGSALAAAGLEAGDVLYSWERPPHLPANPQAAAGSLLSPFSWLWLEVEEAQRGPLRLYGQRAGDEISYLVEPGEWYVHFDADPRPLSQVRPRLPEPMLTDYLAGWDLIEAGSVRAGVDVWSGVAEKLGQAGDAAAECWLLYRIGRAWGNGGNWEAAARSFQAAAEGTSDSSSSIFVGEALGKSYEYQNRFDDAYAVFSSILDARRGNGVETLGVARSHHRIGAMALHLGRPDEALEHFDHALRIRRSLAPGTVVVADSLHARAYLDANRLMLASAEAYMREALAIQEKVTPGSLAVAFMQNTLGSILVQRLDLEGAQEHFEEALGIRETLVPESLSVATTLINISRLLLVRDPPEAQVAMEHLERALRIVQRLDSNSLLHALNLNSLGSAALLRGELEKSADHHRQALDIQRAIAPDNLLVALSLDSLGEIALRRDDLVSAEKHFLDARNVQERIAPGSDTHSLTLYHLGQVYRQSDRLERAAEFFTNSINMLENQLANLGGSQDVRGFYRAERRVLYRDAIEVHLDLNRPEKAFHLSERYRGQVFLEMVAERRSGSTLEVPPEPHAKLERIRERYDQVLREIDLLRASRDEERIDDLVRERRSLREEYNRFTVRKKSSHGSAFLGLRPLSAAEVINLKDTGTVMLSFSVGKERTDLFIISASGGLSTVALDIGESELRKHVNRFRLLIQEPPVAALDFRRRQLEEESLFLYGKLIKPVAEYIDRGQRVLILPDGPLHVLPFGALVRHRITEGGGDELEYMVEWKPFHIALSATIHDYLSRSQRQDDREDVSRKRLELVAFGDPFYSPEPQTADRTWKRAIDRGLFKWKPIPSSRREIEGIASYYPADEVRLFLGEEATEDKVKLLGQDSLIIHFATHGYLDDRSPLDSALVLSIPLQFELDRENGLLQAWEILEQMELDTNLVVLSACQSALGGEQGGEGLIGLTWAFLSAGARSVVASLWQVDDRATADLMVRFYRHLRAGMAKNDALRAAQLELLRGENREEPYPADSAPYYWAAFQLIGDWR